MYMYIPIDVCNKPSVYPCAIIECQVVVVVVIIVQVFTTVMLCASMLLKCCLAAVKERAPHQRYYQHVCVYAVYSYYMRYIICSKPPLTVVSVFWREMRSPLWEAMCCVCITAKTTCHKAAAVVVAADDARIMRLQICSCTCICIFLAASL